MVQPSHATTLCNVYINASRKNSRQENTQGWASFDSVLSFCLNLSLAQNGKRKVLIMTSQSNYTTEEWNLICKAPLSVGGAIAAASASGVVGTLKEGMAITNGMRNAAQHHLSNQLIQEVVPKGISREQIDSWANTARGMLNQSSAASTKKMGIETCRQVSNLLRTKSDPREAEEYKRWLLEIGKQVAESANEAANVGGVAVSQEEAQTLNEIASALGMPPT